jgi:hypothetical protein
MKNRKYSIMLFVRAKMADCSVLSPPLSLIYSTASRVLLYEEKGIGKHFSIFQ